MAHLRFVLALSLTVAAIPASAQYYQPPSRQAERDNQPLGEAGHIVTQPARDVGLSKIRIPAVLKRAAASPYGNAGTSSCSAIRESAADLDDALGPDYGHRLTRHGSRTGEVAQMAGTAIVNSLIPFRGLIREISGADARQRRLAAAIQAGYARRGYLHGLWIARRCPGRM